MHLTLSEVFRFCYIFVVSIMLLFPLSIYLLGPAICVRRDKTKPFYNRHLLLVLCLGKVIKDGVNAHLLHTEVHFEGSNGSQHDSKDMRLFGNIELGGLRQDRLNEPNITFETERLYYANLSNAKKDISSTPAQNATTIIDDSWRRFTTESADRYTTSEMATSGMSANNHSKSGFYKLILSYYPILFLENQLEDRSCRNKCGKALECSCRPHCLHFKTCCKDFVEECSDAYNFTQLEKETEWLELVETQCLSNNIVVDSCYNSSVMQINYQDLLYWYSPDSGPLKDDLSTAGNSLGSLNSKKKITLVELLRLLLVSTDKTNQTYLTQMFTTTPILDTSTGISYRNASVYICNKADIHQAKMWMTFYEFDWTLLLPSSKIQAVQGIFDMTKLNFNYPFSTILRQDDADIELCNTQSIHLCPVGFYDYQISQACENTNFYLRPRYAKTVYKNLFCLFCNLELADIRSGHGVRPINFYGTSGYTHPIKDVLEAVLDFRGHGSDFVLKQIKWTKEGSLTAEWASLICRFFVPSGSGLTTTNASSEGSKVITSECNVYRCLHKYVDDVCVAEEWYVLILPPATYELSNEYLKNLLDAWKKLLIHNWPYFWNTTHYSETLYHVSREPIIKNGLSYKYFFGIKLYNEITGTFVIIERLRDHIKNMISQVSFPFKKGYSYGCCSNTDQAKNINSSVILCGYKYHAFSFDNSQTADDINGSHRFSVWKWNLIFLFLLHIIIC